MDHKHITAGILLIAIFVGSLVAVWTLRNMAENRLSERPSGLVGQDGTRAGIQEQPIFERTGTFDATERPVFAEQNARKPRATYQENLSGVPLRVQQQSILSAQTNEEQTQPVAVASSGKPAAHTTVATPITNPVLAAVNAPQRSWPSVGQHVADTLVNGVPVALTPEQTQQAQQRAQMMASLPLTRGNKQGLAAQQKANEMIRNLSNAVTRSIEQKNAPKSKREQNIEKYAALASGKKPTASQTPSQLIAQQTPALVNQMNKAYGPSVGKQAQNLMNSYAKEMEQAASAPTEEQRLENTRKVHEKYTRALNKLEENAQADKLQTELEKYKADYLARLSSAYNAQTAAAAAPLFNDYIGKYAEIYKQPDTLEGRVKSLTDLQAELDKNLDQVVRQQNSGLAAPLAPLNKIREDLLKENMDSMSDELDQLPISHKNTEQEQAELKDLRAQRERLNKEYLDEIMKTPAMQSLTPEQQQYWQTHAQERLNQLTQDLEGAYKSSETHGQWIKQSNALIEQAQKELGEIEIPLSEQQRQMQEQANEYLAQVEQVYGPETAQQIKSLQAQAQQGQITSEQLEKGVQSLLESKKSEALEAQRAQLRQASDDYIAQTQSTEDFKQLTPEQQARWTQQARGYLSALERDMMALAERTDLTAQQMEQQAAALQKNTQKKLQSIRL